MTFNPDIHHRRSIRLRTYDYASAGAYFVTICSQGREYFFGQIDDDSMALNDAGRMIETVWNELPERFPKIELDAFVVMPNHVHGLIFFHDRMDVGSCNRPESDARRGESCIRPGFDVRHNQEAVDYNHKKGDQDSGDLHLGDHKDRPYGTLAGSLGRVLQTFKSITTHKYTIGVKQFGWPSFSGTLWQRNYYERIIRNEEELNKIREYIQYNPARWMDDEENIET